MEQQWVPPVALTTCRRYVKDENATFFANLKDHFNDFVNSPFDEHKACIQDTTDKVLQTKKTVAIQKADKEQAVVLGTTKTKKQNKPKFSLNKSIFKNEFPKMSKVVANQL